jgi:AcrR family transcriptional regulator
MVTSSKDAAPHDSAEPRTKPRGSYRHGDLKNALLDAAAELVAARGGPDFSLREIATRVGVRHAAAYRHFASKEAILSNLAVRAFEHMAKRFKACEERCGADANLRLEGLADAYMAMVREEPGAYRVMFANVREHDPARDAAARECFNSLLMAVEEGQRCGVVRTDMPAIAIAAGNWAALHGLAMLLLDKRLSEAGPAGGADALLAALRKLLREGWLQR